MGTSLPPAIADLIRTGRLRKGLNQEDLAQQAGVSRTTLHHLERGDVHRPRASTLSRLATVLDLNPEELARGWPQTGTESSVVQSPPEALREQVEFDRATNPQIAAIREEFSARFRDITPGEWEELASQVGVGGALTSEGVVAAAERLQADRDTLAQLKILLQTHMREPARRVIEALYQSVSIASPDSSGRFKATPVERSAVQEHVGMADGSTDAPEQRNPCG